MQGGWYSDKSLRGDSGGARQVDGNRKSEWKRLSCAMIGWPVVDHTWQATR